MSMVSELLRLRYVNGADAAKLGYVNAGTDRRVGGPVGRLAGRIQSRLSFKSPIPPTRIVEEFDGVWLETATAMLPRGATARQHVTIATRRGSRWFTIRAGWRYDANWGDAGTRGYNPNPEIVGGYIFDVVFKLNAPVSFIPGVE